MSENLFTPPEHVWQRLERGYLFVKMARAALGWSIFGALLVVPAMAFMPDTTWQIVAAIAVALLVWRVATQPRLVARWGYAETDDALFITHGLFMRHLACVPYGRMQLVNVSSGPLERAFSLASVQLVTASSAGTLTVPGLNPETAAELRDRLVERSAALQAGL